MRTFTSLHKPLLGLLAAFALAACAQAPSHIGRHESTAADADAILQVTKDFRTALLTKDGPLLSGLLLNNKILFSSPVSPARVQKMRDEGRADFDGIDANGAASFVDFVSHSKETVEEKFYNIKITQDRHVAWVMFDFEFVESGKVENYGIETWQLVKTPDESWKILSVVWSSHGAPK